MFKISVKGNCLREILFPLFTCQEKMRKLGQVDFLKVQKAGREGKPLGYFLLQTPTPWSCLGPNRGFGKGSFQQSP